MKQINLIINGKGGVGKSFFATNFVDYLIDHKVPHVSIDTDNENSTLKRFHPECEFIDISSVEEIDTIITKLDSTDFVVADCRAASTDIFLDYFAEVRIYDILRELKTRLTVVSPVNHEADSVEQIRILTDAVGKNASYVIVRNHAHSERFTLYDNSNVRKRLLDELGAKEIVMPKLYDWLVIALNAQNVRISQAISNNGFNIVDRQRLLNWRDRFFEQVDSAKDHLLPRRKHAAKEKVETAAS